MNASERSSARGLVSAMPNGRFARSVPPSTSAPSACARSRRRRSRSYAPSQRIDRWNRRVSPVPPMSGGAVISGFEFRYRANGGQPTVRGFRTKGSGKLSVGDLISDDRGEAALGVTGSTAFVGVVIGATAGTASPGVVAVITDVDAVYGVIDGVARSHGMSLDVAGDSGEQYVAHRVNGDLEVVRDSGTEAETLVRIGDRKHHDMSVRAIGGPLNAAIARAVAHLHREMLGRGPTKAQAFYRHDVVVVILREAMTTTERSLEEAGKDDAVLESRRALQEVIGPDLVAAVERLTDCKVEAFMSMSHLRPDLAVEVFVLDRPVSTEP